MDIISCYSRFVNFRKLTMMEEVLLRFPHIGEKIFEELNYQSLIDCQKVSSSWKSFLLSRFRPSIRVTEISTKCSEEKLDDSFKGSDDSKKDKKVNDTDDSLKGSDDSEDQTTEDEEANDTDDSYKGSNDSENQTTEDEEATDTDDSLNGSNDSEEQTSEDAGDWHESNGGWFGSSDDSQEDEEVNDTDDSLNGSNDLKEQFPEDWHESNGGWFGGSDNSKEDEEVNDPDDSLNGSDDSKEQFPEEWHKSNGGSFGVRPLELFGGSHDSKVHEEVNGTDDSEYENPAPQPLEAKKTIIEPSVTAEEVTDSEFDKFMIALFGVFDANEKEQLPIDDVKMAIFEQTSITEGQFSTCIRKVIDLNEARYIGKVLYLI